MMIRKHYNSIAILLAFFTIATFIGCEKDVSELKVGIENVYIPQSFSVTTSDNNYAVPGGVNFGDAKNFRDDEANNKLEIFLGVSKSGKETTAPFTVDVTSRPDTINQLVTNGASFLAVPSATYTLPASVSVDSGQSTAGFSLLVDKNALKNYSGKKVAVCVAISNPTKYSLRLSASQVIVIIDVDALKLK